MRLFDVNVLVYAHRSEQAHHALAATLLDEAVNDVAPFAISEQVLGGFVRVATTGAVYGGLPTALPDALAFANALVGQPNARVVRPGPRHWAIFTELCEQVQARGNLVADAQHAALAIEHGCEWVTFDRDFSRFPGLRWSNPLDD